MMRSIAELIDRNRREKAFRRFLKESLSREHFTVIKKCCWHGRMSSYFGFYENLEVSFSPAYDHLETLGALSVEQSNAFYTAFRTLKEKAPPDIKETIRQFCHC